MPFSSLFSRKASRKNQSKDKSGQVSQQSHPSEDGISKEVPQSDVSPGKKVLSHADSASQEELQSENTCEDVGSTQVQTRSSALQDIQTKHNGDQKTSYDNCNKIPDVEGSVSRLNEDGIQMEGDKNLSLEKSSKDGSSECVGETGSLQGANGQEQQDNTVTHSANVLISQNGGIDEENQLNTGSVAEQVESISEEHTVSDESTELNDTGITSHKDVNEEIIAYLSQKKHLEDSESRLEKNEGTEGKICSQDSTPNATTHTPTAELSNEETVVFSETNNSEEPQTSDSVINVLESESAKEVSSVVADIQEQENESVLTDCSNNTNSVLSAKTASENEHLKNNESATTECESEENVKMVICLQEEILSESKSIGDFSCDGKNAHVIGDSQTISTKEQSVVAESENMAVQSCPPATECEGVLKETESSDKEVMPSRNNTDCEFENISVKDFDVESSKDPEIRTQARSSDMGEALEERDYTPEKSISYGSAEHDAEKSIHCGSAEHDAEKSIHCGSAEHDAEKSIHCGSAEPDTEKVQDNEIVLMLPPSSTNISSVISNAACTDGKNNTQIMMDISNQNRRNSDQSEQKEINEVNDENTNSRTEILESYSILTADKINDIEFSQNFPEEPTSPLEDSFDSFPSGCEDFLGGQRTMMAAEQHPPHSWKVGYLQVKQPAKSRGRGKLKVWRQRWVVFQMDEFVKDSKNPSLMINIYASECSNARTHNALFFCTVSASKTVVYRSQSRTHKYAFSVSVDNDVVLHLAADTETASQEWMAAIRNLLWPPSPVLQLEKVLHGSDFEVSVIDNEFSFHAGLLGTYGNMKVTSNKLILTHPQTDHVIQEWYLNTLDKFQVLPQNKEEDAFKVVVMHTGQDSSTGSGQIILFCTEAVTMLQSIASTIHKLLQFRTTSGKDHKQKELADLAEWLSPALSQPSTGDPPEDYYKIPRRQIRSLLDIPNFSFEKPLSNEGLPQSQESVVTKPSMLTSATSASTFSEDSGISMAIHPDDFLNCSVTSFTIGGRPVRDHTSSESSDGYSPPCTPEIQRKQQETETT